MLRIDPILWKDDSLNYPEKLIVNYIWAWQAQDKCCFVSNQFLADAFGWEPGFVNDVITLLKSRSWVNVRYPLGGGTRMLSINLPGQPDPCDDSELIDVFEV